MNKNENNTEYGNVGNIFQQKIMYEKAIDSLQNKGQKLLIQDHFYSENNAPFHKTSIEIVFNAPFSKYEFLIYS